VLRDVWHSARRDIVLDERGIIGDD
jgi:hypothetical protein